MSTSQAKSKPLYRYADGRVWNSLAMAYSVGGYAAGIGLLLTPHWLAKLVGLLLLAHAMVIGAYLIHEFAHGTIFSKPAHNARAGEVFSWMTGGCYADFQDLRRKHMRHHVDRADVITFDSKEFINGLPAWTRKLILALEWAYIPAVELIMHFYVVLTSTPMTLSPCWKKTPRFPPTSCVIALTSSSIPSATWCRCAGRR